MEVAIDGEVAATTGVAKLVDAQPRVLLTARRFSACSVIIARYNNGVPERLSDEEEPGDLLANADPDPIPGVPAVIL